MSGIKIRTKRLDGNTQIRLLITHPMANGRGQDKHGKPIPAEHITVLSIAHNGATIMTAHLSGSMAKNPYLDCLLKGGNKGDEISISWSDNLGQADHATQRIK